MNPSDVDDASTKSLCSYFKSLNNVMAGLKSLLKKSHTDNSEVKEMRENVKKLHRFLKIGNNNNGISSAFCDKRVFIFHDLHFREKTSEYSNLLIDVT